MTCVKLNDAIFGILVETSVHVNVMRQTVLGEHEVHLDCLLPWRLCDPFMRSRGRVSAAPTHTHTHTHSLTNTELDAHDVFLFYDVLLLDDQCIRVMRLIARSCYFITMLVIISVWLSCSCVQRSITVMRCYTKDWSSGTYSLQNSCCFSVFKSCIYSPNVNVTVWLLKTFRFRLNVLVHYRYLAGYESHEASLFKEHIAATRQLKVLHLKHRSAKEKQ